MLRLVAHDAFHLFDKLVRLLGRKGQEIAGRGRANGLPDHLFHSMVEHHRRQLPGACGCGMRKITAEIAAHIFGQHQKVLFLRTPYHQTLQNALDIAHRNPFFQQTPQHIGNALCGHRLVDLRNQPGIVHSHLLQHPLGFLDADEQVRARVQGCDGLAGQRRLHVVGVPQFGTCLGDIVNQHLVLHVLQGLALPYRDSGKRQAQQLDQLAALAFDRLIKPRGVEQIGQLRRQTHRQG